MDKELLRLVIADQRKLIDEKFGRSSIIEREADTSRYLKHPTALIILGVRRSGKSTLAVQSFLGTEFGYINFDDERLLGATKEDLNSILQVFYELYGSGLDRIILDEIQEVYGWELFVSRLRDTKTVIVTGSSSKLLSGELATHLTGRHLDVRLFPFSFREFLKYKRFGIPKAQTTASRAELVKLLDEYMDIGGFPERIPLGEQIVTNIYNDIITKDVILRHRIKHMEDLRQVARYLITNSAREFTYSSLKGVTRVKNAITLSNWLRYLEEAYLVFKLERFSYKLKQSILAPKKIYCVDNGIINAIGVETVENRGRLMENLVAIELLKGSMIDSGYGVFYWKDHQGREVDFVVREGRSVVQLIQVTFASDINGIKDREIESLLSATRELRCRNLLVITWDCEGKKTIGGRQIAFVPLWKWLLESQQKRAGMGKGE